MEEVAGPVLLVLAFHREPAASREESPRPLAGPVGRTAQAVPWLYKRGSCLAVFKGRVLQVLPLIPEPGGNLETSSRTNTLAACQPTSFVLIPHLEDIWVGENGVARPEASVSVEKPLRPRLQQGTALSPSQEGTGKAETCVVLGDGGVSSTWLHRLGLPPPQGFQSARPATPSGVPRRFGPGSDPKSFLRLPAVRRENGFGPTHLHMAPRTLPSLLKPHRLLFLNSVTSGVGHFVPSHHRHPEVRNHPAPAPAPAPVPHAAQALGEAFLSF
ncbi:unnamed protein product [Rangifer tarandus platyrhynchus]|uniref:Uncharacterized protein n=1 Tax=Rangifer tarandus platyrhynchus TaxID=3082113 RepID=A0AC59ZUJ3_RANTA